ncbi:MAG: pyridoxamine 5'-phosphate oxidase family protein [Erysipelotrichaceae bacterium]|nr:pyridoxamine 5'-phosphate oxidase family protein [Erysipelotrichaceae bacterium]
MFREMRRAKQQLNDEDIERILNRHTSGILAVNGDDGYPYTIPISYTYDDNQLFFHSANEGHKIDAIRNNDKVSFCVIDQDEVIQETFTTHFRSVVIFGRATIITDPQQRQLALESLVRKYSPDFLEKGQQEIREAWDHVSIIAVTIEYKSGKTNNK